MLTVFPISKLRLSLALKKQRIEAHGTIKTSGVTLGCQVVAHLQRGYHSVIWIDPLTVAPSFIRGWLIDFLGEGQGGSHHSAYPCAMCAGGLLSSTGVDL